MNKRINELIPVAISVIHKQLAENKSIEVPETYKGYISAFSGSIVQSGLLAALTFYSEKSPEKNDETKSRRNKMLCAIKTILLKKGLIKTTLLKLEFAEGEQKDLLTYTMKFIDPNYNSTTDEYTFELRPDRSNIIRNEIIDAAIALKMGLRIFKMKQKT